MDLDLLATMRTNGAVRAFHPDPVDDATLVRILDAARFAPSGGNRQGWGVIVVKDPEVKQQLADLTEPGWREYRALLAAGVVPFAARDDLNRWPGSPIDLATARATEVPFPLLEQIPVAPALLVVTADLRELAVFDCELGRQSVVGGASIYPFCQNILLAARTEGLGGVLTTFLSRREPQARPLLHLPGHVAIAAMLVLGRPVQQATKLTRRPVAEFAHIDTHDGPPLTG